MQHLSHAPHICFDVGHRRVGEKHDLDITLLRAIQIDDLVHELVQTETANFYIGCSGIIAEGVYHFFHRLHLLHDRVRRPVEDLGFLFGHRMQVLAPQPLGRELDRRQWILDFVSESARDLAPRRIALGLKQGRDVIEDDDVAGGLALLAGQGCTGAGQYPPADFAAQHDLLSPLGIAGIQVNLRDVGKLLEKRMIARDLEQRLAGAGIEICSEYCPGRLIGVADAKIVFEREHPGRQSRENNFEIGALGLDLGL